MTVRVRKQLPIADGPDEWNSRIRCNWDDCGLPGSNLHRVVICHAAGPLRHANPRDLCQFCEVKTFCTAQHADMHRRSHVPGQYGRLSAGVNGLYLLWAGLTRLSRPRK